MDFSLIPAAALAVAILGLAYGWRKDRSSRKREQGKDQKSLKSELEKERAYKKAAKDHGLAAQYLRIIVPRSFGSYGVYENVIVDQGLRERVTIYLGKQNTGTLQFDPYQLSQDQLNNPECCRTIADVIAAVEAFKKNSPDKANQLNLPQR